MRHFLCLLLLCTLLLLPFITQAQSYSESDKEGLRFWLRQASSESGISNFQSLGLSATDTIDWNMDELWLEKLQEPSELSYIDWEWDMGIPANLVRLEIKTFDDSRSVVSGDINCTYFFYLQELDCANASIKSIDLSRSIKLKKLNCSNNYLTDLNLNICSVLSSLDCSGNELNSLVLTQNLNLEYLNCSNNALKTLEVSDNTTIHTLSCANNRLSGVNLPKSNTLENLDCSNNNLTSLNISKYPNLKLLSIGNNQISNLNISSNPLLLSVYMDNNALNEVNLSSNSEIRLLDVTNNSLSVLDVSPHNELEYLFCPNNELESLHLLTNTNLKVLNCAFNNISELAYSSTNANLYSFRGNDNNLKFSTLPLFFAGSSMTENIYAPQADWDGGEVYFKNPVDLSSEFEFQGKKTSYTWVYDSDIMPIMTPHDNGVFYATINDDYYSFCKLTNLAFPDLELNYRVKILKDTIVGIVDDKDIVDDLLIYYDKVSQSLKIISSENILSVDLYDTMGRCLLSAHDLGSDGSVQVPNPYPGVYIARVTTETRKSATQKISIY